MAINYKVQLIGAFDMLKFKNMSKVRDQHIDAAPAVDVTADLAINKNAAALHPVKIDVVVADVISLKPDAKTFVFAKEDGSPLPYFRAGAYISVRLKIGDSYITRPISLSSSPADALKGIYKITVKTVANGFASEWMLANLKQGDKLEISAPLGDFAYDRFRDSKDVVAIAGGSGITPFLSMAGAICEGTEDFNLTILYGSNTREDILFEEEFTAITKACPKVKVVNVLANEEVDGYEHGFISKDIISKYSAEACSYFICGPAVMYQYVKEQLGALDVPERLIRSEAPGVNRKTVPQTSLGKTVSVTVKQGPAIYEITAACDEPLLVAFERAGIKAPSRCRSGECGWCRSRLTSGECYIPEENDRGRRWADKKYGVIHPCASFPLTDLVIEVPGEY